MWAPPELYYATPDLVAKFLEMSRAVLPDERGNEIVRVVLEEFESLMDIEPLVRLLGGPGSEPHVIRTPESEGVRHA
jgi:hypothetical protein